MKGYVLSVAGVVLLSAVLTAILPEGRMGKFLKGICGLFVFASVVIPLVSLFSGEGLSLPEGELGGDEGYLAACARLLEREDAREAEAFLSEEFCITCTAEADRGTEAGFPLRKICVKISADGIIGQDEHIDMAERIKTVLEEKYGCTAEVIWDA